MNEDIYELLRTAWERNTLQGLFVHFQKSFHNKSTAKAFNQGSLLLNGLRKHRLDSTFFICTHLKQKTPNGQSISFRETLKIPPKHVLVQPMPHGGDAIFQHGGGTHNIWGDAYKHLNKDIEPVYAAAGLYGDACFRGAVTDVLNRTKNSNVVVALDAVLGISTERHNIPDCMREKLVDLEIDPSRLHFTTVEEILEALDQIVADYQASLAVRNFG